METLERNLNTLLTEISQCRLCEKELPLGPNPVVRAHSSATILVAGQAPGTVVHKTSIPFNDPSGIRLREWMGISDELFYNPEKVAIIPMGFCYPGKGKSGDLPPRKECSLTWHARLLKLQPNVKLILPIGQYAQAYYLKDKRKKTLTETVKAWRIYSPHFIPLPHPSPRNNIWLKKNNWFEQEVIPYLRECVKKVI